MNNYLIKLRINFKKIINLMLISKSINFVIKCLIGRGSIKYDDI